MRRTLLTLFGILVGWSAFGQPAKIDSLKRALTTATDTNQVKALYALSEKALSSNYPVALARAQQGLAASERLGWRWGQAHGLETLGILRLRQGRFTQAQQHLLAALALWRALHQSRRAAQTAIFIANLLGESKQFPKALVWGKQALAVARAAHDTTLLKRAYMSLGLLHTWQHQPGMALGNYQQALALAQHLRGGSNMLAAFAHNNMADAYVQLHQARRALPHLFQAVRLARKFKDVAASSFFEGTLAQAYSQLGRLDMAIYHAGNAHRFSTESQDMSLLINICGLLDSLHVRQGNYRLAHQYGAQRHALETESRQQEQQRLVAEAQGRYDTREKERNIQLLTQQNQIAELATRQQRTLRNAAIIIAGLLLLAVGVLYNRYRLRQRTVKLLAEQNQEKTQLLHEKNGLLDEKTLLLQEVHHRVKNNLQLVLSLLNTQIHTLREPSAAAAIRDSQSRVQTMALIHQNLYQSDSLARIDMLRYFTELTEALVRAFRTEATAVAMSLHVAPVQLNAHTVVPLGLIVNELLTNALKYAFPPGRADKQVHLRLEQPAPGTYRLVVADNGVGLPGAVVPARAASLGLSLVAGLCRQMNAVLDVHSNSGAHFTLTFHELPATTAAAFA